MLYVAGQTALVVEDAGILAVEPLEDLDQPSGGSQGGVELAGHLLERCSGCRGHRQEVGLVGQLGMLAVRPPRGSRRLV